LIRSILDAFRTRANPDTKKAQKECGNGKAEREKTSKRERKPYSIQYSNQEKQNKITSALVIGCAANAMRHEIVDTMYL
jgi:hypothetical protein